MTPVSLSWRDWLQLINSVLFCVVGAVLIGRFLMDSTPVMTVILGAVFFGFGLYRLALARREMQKRAGRSG